MSATHAAHSTPPAAPVLYLALELGWNTWKLAFSVGAAQRPRLRPVAARDTTGLLHEIRRALVRFGLPAETPVVSCYEAGRDGFWIHRFLTHHGIRNLVVDSSSIEVNRRARRAKSDRLDATKLVGMLIRHEGGERQVWSVVRVPTVADEEGRQLHRERMTLVAERTGHSNRIKGLLAGYGLDVVVDARLPERLAGLRQWDGTAVPPRLQERVLREFERWQLVDRAVRDRERERAGAIRKDRAPEVELVRRLMSLRGVGANGAWVLVREIFGWRAIKNRRQLAALVGLVPTPYTSGEVRQEQGISKAGNARVRWVMIELAWCWLRYQPASGLSLWYQGRFGHGSPRQRRIGIVALARKLLVAFWKYLEGGEVPEGAEFKEEGEAEGGGGEPQRQAS